MWIVYGMRRFVMQSWMSFRALFGWLNPMAYALIKIINPILQVIFFSILSQYVFKTSDITPWIIGNSILLCSKNAIYGVGSVLGNERNMGTLKLVIASPANKFFVFVGRGIMHIFDAMITVAVGLISGWLWFGLSISPDRFPIFVLALLISLYSAMGIGQLISCIGLVHRDVHLFLNISEYVLMILTGASFPLTRLPAFMILISEKLPLTHGIKAARLIAVNGALDQIQLLLVKEFVIGTIYILIGYALLQYFEHQSRVKATLDLY
ncbi:ABC transporter permease [Fusibacter ferrireducens]|uniref:ABC transporter permease n=1 Tax=Fusibacter ferrireducens TaxID=2785058 RepID=A0ABR9ZZN7_9FIRM|nr:ABC transporter permease [Fusibacter ferrireducens]MBF4695912.1 ABC transporter permease [Fusibacter ferrireducens]